MTHFLNESLVHDLDGKDFFGVFLLCNHNLESSTFEW